MESIIKYSLTIKDKFNTNKLDLSVKDGLTVNDLLYIKVYSNENKVRFFPLLYSDITEYDECIGVDDLNKDTFTNSFIINDTLFIIERRGEKFEV